MWTWAALTTLWERWFPDSPSFEMFDDRIQDGYERSDRREGCREWLEAWGFLLHLTEKLKLGSLRAFDKRFQGTELVQNWVQDVEMALGDLARPGGDGGIFQQRKQFYPRWGWGWIGWAERSLSVRQWEEIQKMLWRVNCRQLDEFRHPRL